MDWLSFASNIIRKIPIERVLLPRPDHTKALGEFAASVGASETQNKAPLEQELNPTTTKEKAIELMARLGCTWEAKRADYPRHGPEIEVFPPEGYTFDGELASLMCHSWQDILERLPQYEILPVQRGTTTQKETSPSPSMTATTQTAEKPPEIKPQEAPRVPLAEPGVSPEQTVDYQNREIGKLLLRMERHYAQRLRINGVPCDCGSSKHLLDLESLCEETIPMVDNPGVYYRIIEWIKKVGPKSTDEAAKSGLYDEQYPIFSHEARDFRKEIIGSLDPSALFPQKPGEPEGTRILPVISEEEKEEIRQRAHQKIEEVLGNANQ